jgi:hypothetical protein
MICFIYDYSNDGIIWTGRKITVANKIKEGLLDTEMSFLNEGHPMHDSVAALDVRQGHFTWNMKAMTVVAMQQQNVNPLYLEKKRLAQLRSRIFPSLYNIAHWASRKTIVSPVAGIEGDIQKCLDNCDPEGGIYDFNINEYALTNDISAEEAYKELNLRVENFRTQRIRIYSQFEYFSKKINQATTGPEMQILYEEIVKKFVKDMYI